jgi:hypothetical protein
MQGRQTKCFWCEPVDPPSTESEYEYRRVDTGETFILGQAPPGALYYADWLSARGPDGHCLIVITPWGPWNVDNGFQLPSPGNWTRSGAPPNVTARPSIGQGGKGSDGGAPWSYHALLTDGVLVEVE